MTYVHQINRLIHADDMQLESSLCCCCHHIYWYFQIQFFFWSWLGQKKIIIYHAVHWRHYLKHILCSDDLSTVLSCHLCPRVLWHLAEVSYSTWANSSERNQMTQSFSVPCLLAFLMPATGIRTLCQSGSIFSRCCCLSTLMKHAVLTSNWASHHMFFATLPFI